MSIECVGVVGSGVMGAGVAEVAAASGARVRLRARDDAGRHRVLASIDASLARAVEKGRLVAEEATAIRERLSTTTELAELAECDLIVETVVENLDVKRELFRELGEVTGPSTILATCTSTLTVFELAAVTAHPERVCGLHFFNPVPIMSLVEVVRPLSASDVTIYTATAFARACGKEPVEVLDRAGFIVNALLFPYLNDAIRLFEEGVGTKEGIDAAMRGGCGFPLGPFALLDLVGLDTSLAILEALHDADTTGHRPPGPLLRQLVAAGRLGRKSGEGFYTYDR